MVKPVTTPSGRDSRITELLGWLEEFIQHVEDLPVDDLPPALVQSQLLAIRDYMVSTNGNY